MADAAGLLELVSVIGAAAERGEWSQEDFYREITPLDREIAHIPNVDKNTCGTTMCAAGWKATIDGIEFNCLGDVLNGPWAHVADYAQEALDLTGIESDFLFFGVYDNDFEKFSARVNAVLAGEITDEFSIRTYQIEKEGATFA